MSLMIIEPIMQNFLDIADIWNLISLTVSAMWGISEMSTQYIAKEASPTASTPKHLPSTLANFQIKQQG